MRTRSWVIALGVLAGIVATSGAVAGAWQEWSSKDAEREQSRNDGTVRAYLKSVTEGNYGAAYALVCTDETGTDRSSFEQAERGNPIRGFEIESSTTWSSWADGHGRSYRVRVTRATGAGVIEISTQGSDTVCIQYRNIEDLRLLPSSAPPIVRMTGQPASPVR